MGSPYKNVFVRGDFGIIEEMFGAVGGEVLYRPFNKRYALGLTLHKVKQRDYDQRFSFRDYETVTGHLGLYYDFPKLVSAQLLMGKYLAKDKGVSLDLSKRFNSGFALGILQLKLIYQQKNLEKGVLTRGFIFPSQPNYFIRIIGQELLVGDYIP